MSGSSPSVRRSATRSDVIGTAVAMIALAFVALIPPLWLVVALLVSVFNLARYAAAASRARFLPVSLVILAFVNLVVVSGCVAFVLSVV